MILFFFPPKVSYYSYWAGSSALFWFWFYFVVVVVTIMLILSILNTVEQSLGTIRY